MVVININKCLFCDNILLNKKSSAKYCSSKCYFSDYRIINKSKLQLYHETWYNENKENIRDYCEKHKHRRQTTRKANYQLNIEKERKKSREYYYKNKKKQRLYNKEYQKKWKPNYIKNREKNDIEFKILNRLRSRIRRAIQRNSKAGTTLDLLGCTTKKCREHLENQFLPNMTWKNYGFGNDKWNIDHIIPCDSFNMKKFEDQKKCFHYTNLQPLWQKDNLLKNNKLLFYRDL